MSTKIYGGMVSSAEDNIFALRRAVDEVLVPLYQKNIQGVARSMRDKRNSDPESPWHELLGLDERFVTPYVMGNGRLSAGSLHKIFAAEFMAEAPSFFAVDNPFYEVVLMENSLGGGALPLALLFCAPHSMRDSYREALIEAGVMEDFSYWDNSDAPEEVSGEEWLSRKKAWSKISVPAKDGFSFRPTLYDVYGW